MYVLGFSGMKNYFAFDDELLINLAWCLAMSGSDLQGKIIEAFLYKIDVNLFI